MMSSCCTLRLKRRKAFSKDSDSWMMTSATLNSPPIRFGLVTCGVVVYGAPPMSIIACIRRHVHEHVDRIMGHLVVNSGIGCQVILVKRAAARKGKQRSVSARNTYTAVVTVSKVLDLVGIPSIFLGARLFFDERRDLLLVRRQAITTFRAWFRSEIAWQSKPCPTHPNLRRVT
jgi:hypothetical protein